MVEWGPESGKDEQYQAPKIEGAPINEQTTARQVVEPVESAPINKPARSTENIKGAEKVTLPDVEKILSNDQVVSPEDTQAVMEQVFLGGSEEEIEKDVAWQYPNFYYLHYPCFDSHYSTGNNAIPSSFSKKRFSIRY